MYLARIPFFRNRFRERVSAANVKGQDFALSLHLGSTQGVFCSIKKCEFYGEVHLRGKEDGVIGHIAKLENENWIKNCVIV